PALCWIAADQRILIHGGVPAKSPPAEKVVPAQHRRVILLGAGGAGVVAQHQRLRQAGIPYSTKAPAHRAVGAERGGPSDGPLQLELKGHGATSCGQVHNPCRPRQAIGGSKNRISESGQPQLNVPSLSLSLPACSPNSAAHSSPRWPAPTAAVPKPWPS